MFHIIGNYFNEQRAFSFKRIFRLTSETNLILRLCTFLTDALVLHR